MTPMIFVYTPLQLRLIFINEREALLFWTQHPNLPFILLKTRLAMVYLDVR